MSRDPSAADFDAMACGYALAEQKPQAALDADMRPTHAFNHRRAVSGSGSACKPGKRGLVFRSTFLHFEEEDSDSTRSPRASSDPGSETSKDYFYEERCYVENLSEKMFETEPVALDSLKMAPCETSTVLGGMTMPELKNHMRVKAKDITANMRRKKHSEALSAIDELPEQVGDALLAKATRMVDTVNTDVIMMQSILQEEDNIACDDSQATQAMQSLEAIPDIIMDSFEANVAKAKGTFRVRVDGVLQSCDAMDTQDLVCAMRKIPIQVQAIADQAVQDAIKESKQQATQQLDNVFNLTEETAALRTAKIRMLERIPAVMPFTEDVSNNLVVDTVEQAVAAVEEQKKLESSVANVVVADTLLRAKTGEDLSRCSVVPSMAHVMNPARITEGVSNNFVVDTVERAVAAVEDQKKLESSSAKMVIAGEDSSLYSVATRMPHAMNPGSIGHPELCPRPCLYFMAGMCSNGNDCEFCHMLHERRPAHLDKRHREMLKEIPFADCAAVALPHLRAKVVALGLGQSALRMLDVLAGEAKESTQNSNAGGRKSPRALRMLSLAMKSMHIRAILTTLHRVAAVNEPSACEDIGSLIHRLRCHIALRSAGCATDCTSCRSRGTCPEGLCS